MINSYSVKSIAFLSLSMILLVGCDNRVADAEKKMADIRLSKSQPIEPPPAPEPVEDFIYSASNERSPFMPPNLLVFAEQEVDNNGIQPNLDRPKEDLEKYNLADLIYRGIMVDPSGEQNGLIQRPDGRITSVKVGDHMGENYGRIVEITATHVNLIEIVPDNRSGFIERAAALVSPAS